MLPRLLPLCVTIVLAHQTWAALPEGYRKSVSVGQPTRIDWTFAVSNQSRTQPPDAWLKGYDSKTQTYELFVPAGLKKGEQAPAVLFISAGDEPQGWKAFEAVCKKQGIVFIGVRGAGNNVAGPKRVRIVLDVLDDVRRQLALDADRTYLAGFSGGGRIACSIGFALPEYIGGILPIGAGGGLRDEMWLRERASQRLSVAHIAGETDFNRGEVERWRTPFLKEMGVRSKVWIVPKLGHALPNDNTTAEAVAWLEETKKARADFAKRFPATRAIAEPARTADAKALLTEGRERLKEKTSLYRGLMQIKGVYERWPDLPEAKEAFKLLQEYEAKADRPWESDDIREQLRALTAEARTLGDYALNGLPPGSPYLKSRPDMLKRCVSLWQQVLDNTSEDATKEEAKRQLTALRKALGE